MGNRLSVLLATGWRCGATASPLRFGVVVGISIAIVAGVVNIRSVSNDNVPNVLIPMSLLHDGNLELSEFTALTTSGKTSMNYWAVRTDNGLYSRYPIWTGVVATPLFAPLMLMGQRALDESFLLRYGRLAALALCAIFGGTLAVMLRRWMPDPWAAALATIAILGTTLWHQVASQLSNQALAIVCAVGLLAIVTRPDINIRRALLAGLLAGLMLAARPPALFMAIAPLGLFLSRPSWRRFIPYVILAAAICPMLTLAYNKMAFGHALSTGYGAEPNERFEATMSQGLIGLMLSPTCGLLIYSPFLLFAVFAAERCIRGGGDRDTVIVGRWLIAGIVGQWLLFSKWWAWNGALTYGGARMLAETIPAWIVLIGMQWNSVMSSIVARRWFLGLASVSVLSYLVGTVTYDVIAPLNPPKPDWSLAQDFIALYIKHHGVLSLVTAVAAKASLLVGILLTAAYLAPRFLPSENHSRDRKGAVSLVR